MSPHSLSIRLYSLVGPWSEGYGPTGSDTVVPPPSLSIPLYPPVFTGSKGYGPTGSGTVVPFPPPLDMTVLSRSDGGGEGMVLRGLVLLCPLPPSEYCCTFSA